MSVFLDLHVAPLSAAQSQSWRSGSNPTRVAALPIRISSLLSSAAELVLSFPQYADVVVSVARKTDASLWPALFTAVGSPSALLEHLLETGALKSAACFLLVGAILLLWVVVQLGGW